MTALSPTSRFSLGGLTPDEAAVLAEALELFAACAAGRLEEIGALAKTTVIRRVDGAASYPRDIEIASEMMRGVKTVLTGLRPFAQPSVPLEAQDPRGPRAAALAQAIRSRLPTGLPTAHEAGTSTAELVEDVSGR